MQWYCKDSGKGAKGKENDAPSLEPQSKCTQGKKILKKMDTMKLHIDARTEQENNIAW